MSATIQKGRDTHRFNHGGANGSSTGTPVGSKCRTLRVTTVKPCSSAVAAISRSAPSWRRAPESRPHRLAVNKSTARIRSPYNASTPSNHAASTRANAGSRCRWRTIPRSISPAVTGRDVVVNLRAGFSDARFYRHAGFPSVVYGVGAHHMGGADEHATVEDLKTVFAVHALAAFDYLNRL